VQQSSAAGSTAAKPKLLVLGATGATARHVGTQALAKGYDVTVLARSAEKAGKLGGAKVILGDALDEATVRWALQGRNAVISALGTPASPFRKVTLLSSATGVLVDAMKAENVRRRVAITGIGAGDSAEHGGFLFDAWCTPIFLWWRL
jgi:putative NADH-flavin reductase